MILIIGAQQQWIIHKWTVCSTTFTSMTIIHRKHGGLFVKLRDTIVSILFHKHTYTKLILTQSRMLYRLFWYFHWFKWTRQDTCKYILIRTGRTFLIWTNGKLFSPLRSFRLSPFHSAHLHGNPPALHSGEAVAHGAVAAIWGGLGRVRLRQISPHGCRLLWLHTWGDDGTQ